MTTELATLPTCPNGHGQMTLRQHASSEASWCGTWYDCPPRGPGRSCMASVLLPSQALLVALESQR